MGVEVGSVDAVWLESRVVAHTEPLTWFENASIASSWADCLAFNNALLVFSDISSQVRAAGCQTAQVPLKSSLACSVCLVRPACALPQLASFPQCCNFLSDAGSTHATVSQAAAALTKAPAGGCWGLSEQLASGGLQVLVAASKTLFDTGLL
jgi:hypothetical protein